MIRGALKDENGFGERADVLWTGADLDEEAPGFEGGPGLFGQSGWGISWCGRGDSNPYVLSDTRT